MADMPVSRVRACGTTTKEAVTAQVLLAEMVYWPEACWWHFYVEGTGSTRHACSCTCATPALVSSALRTVPFLRLVQLCCPEAAAAPAWPDAGYTQPEAC